MCNKDPPPQAGSGEFTVLIVASGPTDDGSLVHAVAVAQPVQSWTVIRSQEDFANMGDALRPAMPGLAPCPRATADGADVQALANSRNELQQWLTSVLLNPAARDAPSVQNFLTYLANIVPPQFDRVPWTTFSPDGQVANAAQVYSSSPSQPAAPAPVATGNLEDMEMDEMFVGDDDGPADHVDSEDEDEYVGASVRYQQVDEPFTEEDEMDMMNVAGEVEMIEDVGSLAQSLGASHLGKWPQHQQQQQQLQQQAAGVQLGSAISGNHTGGLGGAMERSMHGISDSFNSVRPQSAPRLDSFKMVKVIGKGSFGKVFLVREIKTAEMFALKVLKKDNIIKRNQVEHTKTERSVLGYVDHPFIVGMKMAFQSKTKLYFVLDYCAGGELFFHLGKLGKFPEPRACFYAAEIVLAISYVHSLDIIYRDLKPENVLLDAKGHIRLTDFGLSKEGISNSSSGANSFCGTPEYLAPEILNRQGHGRAVDWWSLGALLYEMLTGLPPFYCQDRERLFEKIRKSELHYPPSLSTHSETLLRGLLTKDPSKRLGSGPNDAEDIKRHPFFARIDWDKLMAGQIPPPWAPQIQGTQDTSQFDREFTSMPIFSPQSMQRAHGILAQTPGQGENPFEGFTFTEKSFLAGPRPGTQAQNM